jgi:hypothetical protein
MIIGYVVRTMTEASVPTALNFAGALQCNLHHVLVLNICFAAVRKRHFYLTLLTQSPKLHQLMS